MSDINIVDRVLNDKSGKQVHVVPLVESATQTEYGGKVYRRKTKDGEFDGEDFFETDEPSMMMRNLARPRMTRFNGGSR